jgi:hypothetical protein
LPALFALIWLLIGTTNAQIPGSSQAELSEADEHAQSEGRGAVERYKGETGLISAKTLILGGEFRVTTVIPFKGTLADYRKLEIVTPVSLVGTALSQEAAEKEAEKFKEQFVAKRLFEVVSVVPSFDPRAQPPRAYRDVNDENSTDSLEAPIGTIADMERRDRAREMRGVHQTRAKTLVAVIEVIDYEKGSRWKQALPLDLGKSILTVRLRYYDKDNGQEIGRQIISGQQDGSGLIGPLSPRSSLAAVTEGFVDQVTRRIAAADR